MKGQDRNTPTYHNMEKLGYYNQLRRPPESALRKIEAGRLKGKSDINPQWRIEKMTEVFGPCGIGWKYEITNKWTQDATEGQVFCFVDVNLYIKGDEWSEPIPGTGGSMLIELESRGLHCNDEAYKMALTDALSVAMKTIGVAGDIYAGMHNGSKYTQDSAPVQNTAVKPAPEEGKVALKPELTTKELNVYLKRIEAGETDLVNKIKQHYNMSLGLDERLTQAVNYANRMAADTLLISDAQTA